MGDMERQLKVWADKHVKDPAYFVKMEVLKADDPRVAEHDNLIPVDAMILLPIAKNEGKNSCRAFGFGLGDDVEGPHIDCDIRLAIDVLFQHVQGDCEDCSKVLHLARDLISKIHEGSPVIPLLIAIATDHIKFAHPGLAVGQLPIPPQILEQLKEEADEEEPPKLNWRLPDPSKN